jgi:hypothetical protein
MGIYHGGFDALMAEELLNGSNAIPAFEQVGGERISEGVTGDALDHPARLRCPKAVGNEGLDSVIPVSPKGFHCFFRKRDLSLSGFHYAPSWRAVKPNVSQVAPRQLPPGNAVERKRRLRQDNRMDRIILQILLILSPVSPHSLLFYSN